MTKIDVVAILVFLTFPLIVSGGIIYKISNDTTYWFEEMKYFKNKSSYYFDGASRHHLLDLCHDKDGNIKALFKEDCFPAKPEPTI